jgi:hypothetical protein
MLWWLGFVAEGTSKWLNVNFLTQSVNNGSMFKTPVTFMANVVLICRE